MIINYLKFFSITEGTLSEQLYSEAEYTIWPTEYLTLTMIEIYQISG